MDDNTAFFPSSLYYILYIIVSRHKSKFTRTQNAQMYVFVCMYVYSQLVLTNTAHKYTRLNNMRDIHINCLFKMWLFRKFVLFVSVWFVQQHLCIRKFFWLCKQLKPQTLSCTRGKHILVRMRLYDLKFKRTSSQLTIKLLYILCIEAVRSCEKYSRRLTFYV